VELLITEFMAQNASTLTDEDGDYSDWIEIYDPCLPTVNLDGWYLTDDPAALTKWRFPNVQLNRGGTLLVFASGKNRAVASAPLHTSFKLAQEGEYLALVKPDGTTIAQEFSPYPNQYPDVSYGFPQTSAQPMPSGAQASYHIPVSGDAALGSSWTAPAFDDAAWPAGPTGLGYAATGAGTFEVTYYKANVLVPDLATAEAVAADPALQASVAIAHPSTINYLNTGGSAHFGSDLPFPNTTIGVDVNDFVVVATGSILIPSTGPWTFGVNSDDGFSLELSRQPTVFTSSFPSPRGPADTLATFNILEAGSYTLRLVFYERGGGSELELFAAPGSFASYTSAFHLVGDTTAGGIAVAGISQLIGTDVRTVMQGVNASLWSRIDFSVPDPGAVDLLTLRMAYEDGFVAWLNGVEVARRNAPAALDWNAAATADRPAADASAFELIDMSDFSSLLVPGVNVLAVHGLNETSSDGTFLVLPEMTTVGSTATATAAYFATSTPGTHNGSGYPGVSGIPVFSRASGLFSVSFSLGLTTVAPGAVIRYTLDGSTPTETHGTVYTGAIAVSDSTRIRARVFEAGLAPGQVITRSYVKLGSDVLSFSSNLPIVVVDTFGGGITQEFLAETLTSVIPTTGARATITDVPAFAGPAGLRIRGSSSTSFPKKQFFLEVWDDTKDDLDVSLLGMPAESDWILYAPYTDKTLMRDVLAYKWSNDIGRYAVRTRFVEAFLRTASGPLSSSDYVGVYVLEEKIKQGVGRVNLVDLQPEDSVPPQVTGGYIMKKDRLDPGDTGFLTTSGQRLAFVEPKEEEITTAQKTYLTGYVNQMESALYGPSFADPVNGYAAYIDAGAFIDHHIMVEMTKNIDGFRLSTFMFKDRNGKLNMGPVWDYNLTLGNANYLEGWLPEGWYHDELGNGDYPWYRRIFEDPEFVLRYADRWYALRADAFRTEKLLADVDAEAALLDESQARNYVRWPILGTYVWPNWYIGATYQDEITWMKQWLSSRVAWMDSQFPAPPAFNHAAGQVPTGFGLTITAPAGAIYYTLDGSDPRLPGGAIAPTATSYAGPLVVSQLLHVRARTLNAGAWSAINDATFAPVPPAYVNEVLPVNVTVGPDDHGDFDPWIEIYNPFSTTADLSGLFLTDNPAVPNKWPLPAGTTLCGGQRLIVWADAETLEGPLHANFRLSATGGAVWLFNSAGLALDSLTYPALGSNVSYGRDPDGSASLAPFVHPTPGQANRHIATAIVVNEYNGVAPSRFLANSGTDTFWGRILGNGGDWFELVVVQDHLDLRGWQAIVSDNAGALSTTLTFTTASILSDLRSGTVITISADLASDVSYNPYSGDWWINLRAGTSGDGLYISNLSFSVSQTNTQITIRDATGAVAFGPAGEGINPLSGIGNDEIWKLQEDPGPATTAFSNYQDGTTSTFGSANLWSGGAGVQSLSALRNPVVLSCTTDSQCADANPCTDDACITGHCQNTPNTAGCDDGNACTSGDTCANRACGAGSAVPGCCFGDCECNDGNACTDGDSCQAGACVPGAPVSCDDGNVCTSDACSPPSGSCIATASGACGVGGTVYYYRDDDGPGSEPSIKVVPNVGIDRTQDAVADATTDENGSYALGYLSGDLTVTTVPKFGSPRASDHNDGISSFDASVIGRAAAQILTLSPNQVIAGDVTGDGTISAFDASFVGQFAAGLVDHFDVATAHGSDWAFLRCDAYAFPGAPGCGPPAHVFTPIAGPESGRNFFAILYGDVTGNWTPAVGLAASARASSPEERAAVLADRQASERVERRQAMSAARRAGAGPAGLSLGGWTGGLAAGQRRQVTIEARDADGILGLDLTLRFDPSRVAIVAVSPAGIGSATSVVHSEHSGTCRIAAYGVAPLAGSGPVLQITVQALKPLGPQAPLELRGVANEGRIPLVIGGRHGLESNAR
jgi:hypothetical protein